ncbi:MAG: hypothetical protein Ta2G_17110 [Termitinemataceae bacterium]|nr:MAG: hypothetical protein Ta2G_17110 [Termitinemataceae bacterium]
MGVENQYNEVIASYTNPDGTKKEGWLKAPNGKPTNLSEQQWVQVRTPAFKKWFGDWEAAYKQKEFDALIKSALTENDPRATMILREVTTDEVNEIKKQGGPDITGMQHIITAEELHHAMNRHSEMSETIKHPDQRPLTEQDLKMVAAVIDAPDTIVVQPRGTNRTSIIYGRYFGNGKIEYAERIFETSRERKPRLTTKTMWVKNVATGVKPSPTLVYTPNHYNSVLFSQGRVNPSQVSKPIDENGEPLMQIL